jgi:hypothetical protein
MKEGRKEEGRKEGEKEKVPFIKEPTTLMIGLKQSTLRFKIIVCTRGTLYL